MNKLTLVGMGVALATTAGLLVAAEVTAAPVGAPPTAEMTMASLRTVFSANVEAPNVIVCNNLGRVRLVGIRSPEAAAPGYEKALKATHKYAMRKSLKIEVCPAREKDNDGATRARVFFLEGGQWHCLNEKLLRAGLASAVRESPCHIDFASWGTLVAQARTARRGLFSMGIEIPDDAPARGGGGAGPIQSSAVKPPLLGSILRPSNPGTFARPENEPVSALAVRGTSTKYLANSQTRTLHTPGCLVAPWRPEYQVFFADRASAARAGYRPCIVCRP